MSLIAARRAGPLRRTGKVRTTAPAGRRSRPLALLLVVGLAGIGLDRRVARQSREAALRAFADARYYLSQGEYETGLERIDTALARYASAFRGAVAYTRVC